MDIRSRLKDEAEYIDKALAESLAPLSGSVLSAAMSYALLSPGKRMRPALCLAVYESYTGDRDGVKPALAALEMIHAYSLIQDDLPAMDNSKLRRGKPTTHVVHGEDMALLASDALLTMGFEFLSSEQMLQSFGGDRCLTAVHTLATLAGVRGLVGGQAMDMITSSDEHIGLETIEYIHLNKTAALIQASVLLGGLFGGAGDADMEKLRSYGTAFGVAYQIADDIADATETAQQTGKTAGQDIKNSKATYVSALGLVQAREEALRYLVTARDAAEGLSIRCELLTALVDLLAEKVRH